MALFLFHIYIWPLFFSYDARSEGASVHEKWKKITTVMYFAFYAPKSFCSRSFVWLMLRWFSCFIHETLFMFRYLSFTNIPVTHFLLYENTFHSKCFILPTLQQLIFHFVKKIISFENLCFCNTVTHFLFFENFLFSNIFSSSIS